MKINKSDIEKLHVELLQGAVAMMKHKPNNVPLAVIYYDDRLGGLNIVPVGNVTDKEIKMFAEAIINPKIPVFERTIFTNDPPLN